MNDRREQFPFVLFVCKSVQEYYDTFKILRLEPVRKDVVVPNTQILMLLASRRIVAVSWDGSEQIKVLQTYDMLRTERREGRKSDANSKRSSQNRLGNAPDVSKETMAMKIEYTQRGSEKGYYTLTALLMNIISSDSYGKWRSFTGLEWKLYGSIQSTKTYRVTKT